ncbi:hypothetical protein TREES_T100020694 [Tupaia chinensis]|uniref:Uncharacterized protein n=1 Tax=Tupaia chinensis TaxID=246437 RepID=L9KM41_TUPCH|nr:hypothetical protein TREES_T100020694 [Tupaia chinensis]
MLTSGHGQFYFGSAPAGRLVTSDISPRIINILVPLWPLAPAPSLSPPPREPDWAVGGRSRRPTECWPSEKKPPQQFPDFWSISQLCTADCTLSRQAIIDLPSAYSLFLYKEIDDRSAIRLAAVYPNRLVTENNGSLLPAEAAGSGRRELGSRFQCPLSSDTYPHARENMLGMAVTLQFHM